VPGELRLNTVKDSAKQIIEYPSAIHLSMSYSLPARHMRISSLALSMSAIFIILSIEHIN
jgi:hypothetical protein